MTFTLVFDEADRKVVLQPSTTLVFGGQYTLTIQAGLSDLNGNRTATNFEQSFVVSGDEIYFDNQAPEVDSITISSGKNIKIRFTEEIAEFPAAAIALELNSQPVAGTLTFVLSALEATYTLTDTAVPGAYTLTLSSAIQDEASQGLAAFNQVLLIAVPDQQLYQLERDVVSDSTIGNTIGFQGRNYDSSTGLQYFRARYLDASTGRFISEDPLAFQDSPNHYSAFLNNGANYVDPEGRDYYIKRDDAAKTIHIEAKVELFPSPSEPPGARDMEERRKSFKKAGDEFLRKLFKGARNLPEFRVYSFTGALDIKIRPSSSSATPGYDQIEVLDKQGRPRIYIRHGRPVLAAVPRIGFIRVSSGGYIPDKGQLFTDPLHNMIGTLQDNELHEWGHLFGLMKVEEERIARYGNAIPEVWKRVPSPYLMFAPGNPGGMLREDEVRIILDLDPSTNLWAEHVIP